jgi:hypothetical protein
MFTKSLLLGVGLAALALGEPIPQAAQTTFNSAALSLELASISSLEQITSIYSDLPTLPSSIESVLATAIPISLATDSDFACQLVTAAPAWYNSLPPDVKSALTSYESALVSWSKEHSAALASLTSGLTAPTGPSAFSIGVCSNTGVAVTEPTGTTTGTTAKNTGTAAVAGSTGSGTATGTATSSGSAAAASSSKAAAPRATGTVAISFAGVVGVLGLIAAL